MLVRGVTHRPALCLVAVLILVSAGRTEDTGFPGILEHPMEGQTVGNGVLIVQWMASHPIASPSLVLCVGLPHHGSDSNNCGNPAWPDIIETSSTFSISMCVFS